MRAMRLVCVILVFMIESISSLPCHCPHLATNASTGRAVQMLFSGSKAASFTDKCHVASDPRLADLQCTGNTRHRLDPRAGAAFRIIRKPHVLRACGRDNYT